MNLTKEIKEHSEYRDAVEELIKETPTNHHEDLEDRLYQYNSIINGYQNYIAKVLDAIIELYKREDKQVVGVPSYKDYKQHRKALDSLVFSKEGDIVHLQIREDMDKSSYKITILENDKLKAERL